MMITNLVGKPEAALIDQIEDADNRTFMRQLPNNKGKDFNELFRGANEQAIDLIKKMLTFKGTEHGCLLVLENCGDGSK